MSTETPLTRGAQFSGDAASSESEGSDAEQPSIDKKKTMERGTSVAPNTAAGDDDFFDIDVGWVEPQSQQSAKSSLVDAYMFRLPRAYIYADYIWPGLLMSPERLKSVADFEFRPTDILICSYPKSGTTWVSEVISLIVHGGDIDQISRRPLHVRVPWLEIDDSYAWIRFYWVWQMISKFLGLGMSETKAITDGDGHEEDASQAGGAESSRPRVFFTHLPLELLPKKALDGGVKIIYIARNPKDNAVSFFHFHQIARYLGLQKTTWNEFFPLYMAGKVYCGSWFEHVTSFYRFSQLNDNVLFLKYEDMKRDLKEESRKICKFVGLTLSDESLERVERHCCFGAMKKNKMANRDGVWLFDQRQTKFMRKGVVGDWKNYFTVSQNEFFDRVYAQRMRSVPELSFEFEPNT